MSSFAAAASRFAMVLLPRAAITMTGVGMVNGYGTEIHDLRGQLPARSDIHYKTRPESAVKGMYLHHTATSGQSLRSIAEFHTQYRGWPAIAYHYAIGYDGVKYQLHDITTNSYHTAGHNSNAISVVLVGNYETREMSQEMIQSVTELTAYLKEEYGLSFCRLHTDVVRTQCPGKNAIPVLRVLTFE